MENKRALNVGRKRIGILFHFSRPWMGGIIYLQNIISSLNFLDDENRPEIVVFYSKDYERFVKEIHYPYLNLIEHRFESTYRGYLKSWLKRKNIFTDTLIEQHALNGLYPVYDHPVRPPARFAGQSVIACWLPDLQHKFYPEFFDRKRRFLREMRIRLMLRNTNVLVVSSHDVASHFSRFYKLRKELRVQVLQFVSMVESFDFIPFNELASQYKVPAKYFMVSNAFLKHKNHVLVLKAIASLKKKGVEVHCIFTGRMDNYKDSSYINLLQDLIKSEGLDANLSMLGIISRHHQLSLMKYSTAVIQPSLFEGWSTVNEDAKTVQAPVLAANLPVNIEQMADQGFYFDPHKVEELSDWMLEFWNGQHPVTYESYDVRVKHFAHSFLDIFNNA